MVIEKDLVGNEAVTAVADEKDELVCRHHWVIEPANGPISWGECQICHEAKEFQNSITDTDRDY